MTAERLRVGVIGASLEGGWAARAHMPALLAIPDIEVVALGTSRQESAQRSAEAFGVPQCYSSVTDLLASDVELVAVIVKAPSHARLAIAVVDSGKHLFVEWPMGANLAEAKQIVAAVDRNSVRGFVGLQARASPVIRYASNLILEGRLGQLRSISVFGAYSYWGQSVSAGYSADAECGANILTIPGGHGLDLVRVLAGEFASVDARIGRARDRVMATDLGREVELTAPDQFAAVGTLLSGALFSAHFVGMAPHGEYFRLTLVGDRGELVLEGDGMPEIAPLRLSVTFDKSRRPEPIYLDEKHDDIPRVPSPSNVSLLWQQIARDLKDGTHIAPDLASGLATRQILDAIARSAALDGAPASVL